MSLSGKVCVGPSVWRRWCRCRGGGPPYSIDLLNDGNFISMQFFTMSPSQLSGQGEGPFDIVDVLLEESLFTVLGGVSDMCEGLEDSVSGVGSVSCGGGKITMLGSDCWARCPWRYWDWDVVFFRDDRELGGSSRGLFNVCESDD
jgi:hypothetical protein